ncbi:MAG: 4'-phosphopantetheinyl transferase superfamily protein [Candidatus Marinamargulisbacteria bacterium]|nr:hypothetical protein [bacterium]MDG2264965.1 4'-phosphopantetheinyl transferase superfamily protein [Candidatus Marinamargulisbacteria bacterium]
MQRAQSIAESHGLTLQVVEHRGQGTGWRALARRCAEAQLPLGLQLHRGLLGNPRLSNGGSISMSYTRSLSGVLLGAAGRLIGLDIEHWDRKTRAIQRYCMGDELAWLEHHPNRKQGDVILWSLKEALVKALGTGLRLPKSALAVSVLPQTNGVFVATFPMFPCLRGYTSLDTSRCCAVTIVVDTLG